MLTLDGIDYGNIFCAPGALGFFGEGYPYHKFFRYAGMNWGSRLAQPGEPHHVGFVSKTITMPPRAGNMPMRSDRLTPRELLPKSVIVKFRSGHVLNAVGLTGPGTEWALAQGRWQARTGPFMISFMSVADTPEERLEETRHFAKLIKAQKASFKAPFAIQTNRACPNSGHLPDDFYPETTEMLDILGEIGVPIVVNYNPTVPTEVMVETVAHDACSALWIANTIPWGDERIDWQEIFGTTESPIAARNLPVPGGGGLSGPACLPMTVQCVINARRVGITKPIVAGNGIQCSGDARFVRTSGANAVAIGTVAMVRPWRM
ncbi:hypothetical protein KBC99_03130, partial [Candidatus Saccharibacteria bacterium]|nr:hypothetical protein [Candidatus Saccharibacteria bacterium]